MKSILTQPDSEGKRAKWVAVILEYDIEIKPTKLIKGQGLANMTMDSHCGSLQMNFLAGQSDQVEVEVQVKPDFSASPWYANIIFVL